MPRSPGRHRRPLAPENPPALPVGAATTTRFASFPAPAPDEPVAGSAARRRRPSRLALGTAGGTGAVALAIALLTVAAGPARNGDPTHRAPLADPSTPAQVVPAPAGGSAAGSTPGPAAGYGGAAPQLVADRQTTALPIAPSTAPPMAPPTASASASPSPTPPGQRRANGHRTPTPTPTSTTAAPLPLPLPTLP